MDPSEKGWIDQYLQFIGKQVNQPAYRSFLEEVILEGRPDQSLYKLLQPSGLMYGHPVKTVTIPVPGMDQWDENDKMQLILLDSFLHSSVLIRYKDISSPSDLIDLLFYATDELNNYYSALYPDLDIRYKSFFGRKKSGHEITEEILNKRLMIKKTLSGSFWSSFFQNSLLFLDVFYFGEWLRAEGDISTPDKVTRDQEQMRLTILEVIAAAAHANDSIETEEKLLFEFFLQSAHLSDKNEKTARKYLSAGTNLEDIDLPSSASWVLRKYILELAILTVWSDKIVEESEKEFISQLGKRIGFTENEIEESMLAIESFVITNWEHVHYLQKKHNIHLIRKRFARRVEWVLRKNKDALAQEIRESRELMALLKKSTMMKLNTREKRMVQEQLMDILKTLPTFVVIALPGTFITLPLLLRIMPKSAFPSAFSQKKINLK